MKGQDVGVGPGSEPALHHDCILRLFTCSVNSFACPVTRTLRLLLICRSGVTPPSCREQPEIQIDVKLPGGGLTLPESTSVHSNRA